MNNNLKKSLAGCVAVALTLLAISCNSGNDPWVLKIESKKITKKQFDSAYEGYLTMGREQLQMMTGRKVNEQEFQAYVKNPAAVGNPQLAQVFANFQKRNFLEQYKVMLLLNEEAKKSGFLKDNKVKRRLEYLEKYFIANMYMMDKLSKDEDKIPDADAVAFWQEIKKRDARYQTVPLDQGMELARNEIINQKTKRRQEEVVNNLRDQYRVEANPEFDMEAYLGGKPASDSDEDGKKSENSEANSESKPETPAPNSETEK